MSRRIGHGSSYLQELPRGAQGQRRGLIQTSCPISPGNRGGPLFLTRQGLLAGVNTAKLVESGMEGIGFALPAELALDPDRWECRGDASALRRLLSQAPLQQAGPCAGVTPPAQARPLAASSSW